MQSSWIVIDTVLRLKCYEHENKKGLGQAWPGNFRYPESIEFSESLDSCLRRN